MELHTKGTSITGVACETTAISMARCKVKEPQETLESVDWTKEGLNLD
jgi:hypothetical protein